MHRYHIQLCKYGNDIVYEAISNDAFEYWSKQDQESIHDYVFDNLFEEEETLDVSSRLRLPRWHGDDGQRFSGCDWAPGMTIEVRDLQGDDYLCFGFDDLEEADLVR